MNVAMSEGDVIACGDLQFARPEHDFALPRLVKEVPCPRIGGYSVHGVRKVDHHQVIVMLRQDALTVTILDRERSVPDDCRDFLFVAHCPQQSSFAMNCPRPSGVRSSKPQSALVASPDR